MDYDYGAGVGFGTYLLSLVVGVFYIYCMWRIFVKANKPGWAVIIPVYNYLVELEILGDLVVVVLMLVPVVNIVIGS